MNNVSYNGHIYKFIDPIGKFVLIEKRMNDDLRCVDGIYLADQESYKNKKMGCGKILAIGSEAKEIYNANIGDYVLYDYFSAHGDYKDTIITNAENLILKLTEDEADKFVNGALF